MSRRRPSRSRLDYKHKRASRPRPLTMTVVVAGRCLTPGCQREAFTFCDPCKKAQQKNASAASAPWRRRKV